MASKSKIKSEILNYLNAREKFLKFAHKVYELKGNDNIIGRIGEYIAIEFLRDKGYNPKPTMTSNNATYDLMVGKSRISVKVITSENKSGRTSEIIDKLNNKWDEVILILLNEENKVEKIGQLTRTKYEKARKAKHYTNKRFIADRRILDEKHSFCKYWKISSGKDVKKYL